MQSTTIGGLLDEFALNMTDEIEFSLTGDGRIILKPVNQLESQLELMRLVQESEEQQLQHSKRYSLDEAFDNLESEVKEVFNDKSRI